MTGGTAGVQTLAQKVDAAKVEVSTEKRTCRLLLHISLTTPRLLDWQIDKKD
jgi:hypothetical protein